MAPEMRELLIDVEPRLHPRTSIIRPTGLLTQANRHQLRTAVLTSLAECPTAVVIDAAGVELVDGIAGAVFMAVGREAAAGPGINVLLCRLDGLLARSLMALDPWQMHYPTVAQAVNTIDRGPAVRNWIYRQLPPGPEAESHAGCLVADACTAWKLSPLVYLVRDVMYGLLRDAYRCPTVELHVTMSQRRTGLLLSVRSRIARHRPECPAELEAHRHAESFTGAHIATYHHTASTSDHIGWAHIPVVTK
jgi:hypothetical protein